MPLKHPPLKFNTQEAVKDFRALHRLNQTEFWSRVGVTQSGGSRYERERNIPYQVQVLLQIVYGTEKQAADMVAWLRRDEQAKSGAPHK